jgi:archaeal flagellar protein FlaH
MVTGTRAEPICTGNREIDEILGGGLPSRSLVLLEGESGAGKSVLVQQFTYGALSLGLSVAFYVTGSTIKDLVTQMFSLSLDVTDYFLCDRLRVYPLRFAAGSDSGAAFQRLLDHFESLPVDHRLLVVDALSDLIAQSDERQVADFFANARQLCQRGRGLVVATHPDSGEEDVLERMRSLCDAHLRVHVEKGNERALRILEVLKLGGAEQPPGRQLGFKVEPGEGIKSLRAAGAPGS